MTQQLRFWTLSALLLVVTQAHALTPKDLVGSWKGTHRETVNGTGTSLKITLNGSRSRDGSVRLLENAPALSLKSTYVLKKNGQFTFRAIQSGVYIRASYRGTWKVRGGKIVISGKGTLGRLSGLVAETKSGFKFSGNASTTRVLIVAKQR
jgi:hypothetical protein